MLIAILGRQPKLSLAELESYFGSNKVKVFSENIALVDSDEANINYFGGVMKFAKADFEISISSINQIITKIVDFYSKDLAQVEGKITLGLSFYGEKLLNPFQLQKIGLRIKSKLRKSNSIRLIPNQELTLSTATSHHNKLGLSDKKVELIIINDGSRLIIGKSLGAQNITAYANRDQKRPKRDARVGMLPPKLAQIIINLARPNNEKTNLTILDPFCGTGVLLQESHLMGFDIAGSDKEERMIDFTKQNLTWLDNEFEPKLEVGDATKHKWSFKIDCIASETYLGKPFAKQPSQKDLLEQKQIVENIIRGFLKNIYDQIDTNTRLCLAIPAWKRMDDTFKSLDIVKNSELKELGFQKIKFKNITSKDLLYFRPDQVVAREMLVIKKI